MRLRWKDERSEDPRGPCCIVLVWGVTFSQVVVVAVVVRQPWVWRWCFVEVVSLVLVSIAPVFVRARRRYGDEASRCGVTVGTTISWTVSVKVSPGVTVWS